jgi:hypothetical protein
VNTVGSLTAPPSSPPPITSPAALSCEAHFAGRDLKSAELEDAMNRLMEMVRAQISVVLQARRAKS